MLNVEQVAKLRRVQAEATNYLGRQALQCDLFEVAAELLDAAEVVAFMETRKVAEVAWVGDDDDGGGDGNVRWMASDRWSNNDIADEPMFAAAVLAAKKKLEER